MHKEAKLALLGGVLCHLCYGTLYCWGNSTIYITSYLRQFDSSLTTHDTLPIFAGALLGQAITMPVGGYLEDVLGGQVTSLISALLIATSSFLSAQCTTVTTMLLCQLLFGVGMGTGYVPPMVVGYKHLPKSRGLVSGVIVGGFGAGSFIFNFIITGIINPQDKETNEDGYYDDAEIYSRVPKMYNVLGLIFLALAIPGAWLQRDPEMGGLESSSLLSLADGKSNEEREKEENKEGKTTKEMFADPLAWLLMISLFCTAVGGMYMSATYKAFAGDQGINGDFYFASLGSVGSLFNGFCRVFWGILADKIGVFNAMAVNAACFPILFLAYNFVVKSEEGFFAIVCLLFAVYGGNYSLYPTATCKLFGPKHAGSNYGSLFVLYGVATAIAIYELGVQDLAYEVANYVVLLANCAGLLLVIAIRLRFKAMERAKGN